MSTTLWYQRDASWWNNPDTGKAKRWHLMGRDGFALCNSTAFLDEFFSTHTPKGNKCKRCERILNKKGQ